MATVSIDCRFRRSAGIVIGLALLLAAAGREPKCLAQVQLPANTNPVNEENASASLLDRPSVTQDVAAPQLVMDTGVFSSEIRALTFTADGEYIAASSGSDVRIWSIASGELVHTIKGYSANESGKITALAADPQGNYLAIAVVTAEGSYLRTCPIDDLDNTSGYWGDAAKLKDEALPGVSLGTRAGRELSFSADGKYLALVATTSVVKPNDQIGFESTYLFFDWEKDELAYSEVLAESENSVVAGHFGVPALLEAGRFCGTNRYYVMSGIGRQFDILTRQQVGIDVDVDLQWYGRAYQRIANHYRNYTDLHMLIDADLPNRMIALAYLTKANGRDIYRCDIWRDDDHSPRVTYKGLPWAPSEMKISYGGERVAVGDALGGVHVFSALSGETLFKTHAEVQPVYAASLDQAVGLLGFGNAAHTGAAWKRNDYAAIERGFDLRSRRFIDSPSGKFPRPITQSARPSVRSRHVATKEGSAIELSLANGATYTTQPIPKAFFTWTLADGFETGDVLLLRGGAGYLVADSFQTGPIQPRFGQAVRGQLLGYGSAEKSAVAADINTTSDGKFVTVAWTDGSVGIFEKTDFKPQPFGQLPYIGQPSGLRGMQVDRITSSELAPELEVGDVIVEVNGHPFMQFLNDFFYKPELNQPGTKHHAIAERSGQRVPVAFELAESASSFVLANAQPVLTFLRTRTDDWILYTPEGYYDASIGGHDLIGWKSNRAPDETADFFTARQLRKSLYKPGIIDAVVESILSGRSNARPAQAAMVAGNVQTKVEDPVLDLRENSSLSSILPPMVTVSGLPDADSVQATTITLTAQATSRNDLPVNSIVVLVNGRPPGAAPATSHRGDDGSLTLTQTIDLSPGQNEIAVLATNAAATSTPRMFTVERTTPSKQDVVMPNLYVLSIGVADYADDDYDLRYAGKDAEAFATVLQQQEGKFYRKVTAKVLTDASADRSAIQDGMDWLLGAVTQHDLAVMFISGHGVFDPRRNFYFCSHEVDAQRLRSTALAYTEIERLMEELPCKVLMFADTCHSGGSRGAKALAQDPWTDLVSDEVGAILFASSTPHEESLESEDWGHGAFTLAFLDAMREKKTDVNQDGYISINELDLRLSERVKELSGGRQHPTTQKPSTIRNFNLAVSGSE